MKILHILFIGVLYLFIFVPSALAIDPCTPDDKRVECVFGTISPPPAIKDFTGTDTTGAAGLSQFFSNFVALIFSVAGIVLILMILWGAFDWMISEGDKEKVAAARNKIINAVIGIILFAMAFAIIQVLGAFTGFKFFAGQGTQVQRDSQKKPYLITCPNGAQINVIEDFKDPYDECRRRGQI